MKFFALILLFMNVSYSYGQKENKIYRNPEVLAEFPGGGEKYVQFINKNLKYPYDDKMNGYEGNITVRFIVELDSTLTGFEIYSAKKGTSEAMKVEALRVVSLMKKWIPARLNDQPVRSYVVLPIKFALHNGSKKKKK